MEVEWQEEKKRNVEGSLMRTTCRTTGLFKALASDCFWGWGEFPTLRKNLETWVEKKYKGWQNFSIKSWWWDHALLQETQSDNCGTVQTESTVWLHEHGYSKKKKENCGLLIVHIYCATKLFKVLLLVCIFFYLGETSSKTFSSRKLLQHTCVVTRLRAT